MAFSWKDVQTKVAKAGFAALLEPWGIDGKPGRATNNAVRAWQEQWNKTHPDKPLLTDGVVGTETLKAMGMIDATGTIDAAALPEVPWIVEGKKRLGMSEIKDNAALKKWLASDGAALGDPAKLPWCGDYVQTCLALTLPHEVMPKNPYYALNWSAWGRPAGSDGYYYGSIGTKSRDGGGHVFFIVGHDATHVHALGGNQSNTVSIVRIPKGDVKPARAPLTWNLPLAKMPQSTFAGAFKIAGSEA
jgi:uncharacterized protein (TIGR02594 family)